MRWDAMRCPTPWLRILSRNRSGGKLEKAKGEKTKHLSGNWQRGRFQVECIIHLFLLHGLLVVINETSSSGPAPILVRIGGSFRPGAQSFPLQVVKDYGQGPSSSFVAGQPRRGTWPSPHPKNPTPFSRSVRVCVFWTFRALCRAYFFRLAPFVKWASSASSLWSYASLLIWLWTHSIARGSSPACSWAHTLALRVLWYPISGVDFWSN